MPTLDEVREALQPVREGEICAACGVYFSGKHGQPVLCRRCYAQADPESRLPRATIKEM